jgi:hypothetical protein
MTELTPASGSTNPSLPRHSLTNATLREPLVHFLLAGLASLRQPRNDMGAGSPPNLIRSR